MFWVSGRSSQFSVYRLTCAWSGITFSKNNERPTVPVIVDPNTGAVVQDSWEIALYLDRQYPDKPSLFHGETNVGIHELFYTWSFDAIVMHFAGIVLFQTYDLWLLTKRSTFGRLEKNTSIALWSNWLAIRRMHGTILVKVCCLSRRFSKSTHTSLEPKVCIQPYRNLLKISMANNIVPLSSGSVGCCANCVPSSFTQAERWKRT